MKGYSKVQLFWKISGFQLSIIFTKSSILEETLWTFLGNFEVAGNNLYLVFLHVENSHQNQSIF